MSSLQRHFLNWIYGKPREPDAPFRPHEVRKVLLIRRNGIGDMICSLPLLRNLRKAWPHTQIDVLASEKNACLLQDLDLVNHVFIYTRGRGLFRNHYLHLPRIVKSIRENNYDLVIAIKGGFSSLLAIISYATHIPWRLGYVPSRGHPLDFCFNLKIELPPEREHQVESCLRFLDPLGIPKTSIDLSFKLTDEHERYAQKILEQNGNPSRFVLFNVSSARVESRWSSEAIVQTAKILKEKFNLHLIPCGMESDSHFLQETYRNTPNILGAPAESPSIHHFAALVRRSHFLMCGDGGPMHVAAAMKRPVFVLFSATDPRIWRPYAIPFAYVQRGRFVQDISPSEVIAKIQKWLPSWSPSTVRNEKLEVEPHGQEPMAPAVLRRNPPKQLQSSFAKASEDTRIPPRPRDRGFPRRRVKN